MPIPPRISAVALRTTDLARSTAFYVALGWELSPASTAAMSLRAATGGPGRRGVIHSSPQPDRVNSTDRVRSIRPCLRDELVDAATVRADQRGSRGTTGRG
jgi:catechol 2,3-dioxygenase-like lactoylglutathione lyase family enzyme